MGRGVAVGLLFFLGVECMLTWQDPRKNHLLRSLSESDYVRLEPALELVTLQGGQVLCEPGTKSRHGYFPVSAVVSLVGLSDAGALHADRRNP